METTIEKLKKLYEDESQHNDASRESRIAQTKLCKKQLLGKCFRIKGIPERIIKGEEYGIYLCFTDVIEEKSWNRDYYLMAVVVDFSDVTQSEDWGVQICYQSNFVSNWLDMIEDAEEISVKDFREAVWRARDYVCEKVKKVVEED